MIAVCLERKANASACHQCMRNAASQLAFCYTIGFGVRRDPEMALRWKEGAE